MPKKNEKPSGIKKVTESGLVRDKVLTGYVSPEICNHQLQKMYELKLNVLRQGDP